MSDDNDQADDQRDDQVDDQLDDQVDDLAEDQADDEANDEANDGQGSSRPEDRGEGRDRDGSLHDLQEESGDEAELDDVFSLDQLSAAQAGVELDRPPTPEAPLG